MFLSLTQKYNLILTSTMQREKLSRVNGRTPQTTKRKKPRTDYTGRIPTRQPRASRSASAGAGGE